MNEESEDAVVEERDWFPNLHFSAFPYVWPKASGILKFYRNRLKELSDLSVLLFAEEHI